MTQEKQIMIEIQKLITFYNSKSTMTLERFGKNIHHFRF